ncbi:hypothetical protein [Brucella pituitosa]|uniref:hypothetical protein n=1 Tax=Brucella pituitosa TaxID=571256 RepID=UPI000C280C0F|nr:hypothetical protein [Brucella pituitosa]PQZ48386.1 hypothetical protein CQZ90_15970 [Ochrobactrum sp. MYb19]PRA49415.1 hypothetical protein CQ062_21660 [Ochrobactrum sp. MYb68]PRA74918.1 hypothetical protein CQ049_17190 [Brucella thiophenivorans]PRA85658.1 hypothetical protein CQ054_13250 [Ochrobactrum sp. MYb29]PJO49615.1 hypothetical protein CWE02_07660 [Brucella pituitosa]
MSETDSPEQLIYNISYVYNLSLSLSSNSAALSPSPLRYATANKVRATISSSYVDGGSPAPNLDIILQVNPPADVFTIYDEKGLFIRSYEEGRYRLKTGSDGKVVVYFASTDNIYEFIQLIVERDGTSSPTEYIVFFGDYARTPTHIPPPVVDLDDDNSLNIPVDSPYFRVKIPQQDPPAISAGLSCVAITNTVNFTKQSYSDALRDSGMQIPSAYLSTEQDNEIAYFIENNVGGGSQTSPKVTFKAKGLPYTHPSNDANQNRILTSRPYLNEGQTSITPDNVQDLTVYLPNKEESDGNHTFEVGDTIIFTMYINGYFPGSDTKKVDVFDLPAVEVKEPRPSSISSVISTNILPGYGLNSLSTPGRYDLDYVVKRGNSKNGTVWNRPKSWLKGNLVTV